MSGTVMPTPVQVLLDLNGDPIVGGLLHTFEAGTTTNVATYTDSTLSTPNANPVVADSAGRLAVWLSPGVSYKFVAASAADVTIWTSDNVESVPAANLALDIVGTAGEALSENDVVFLADSAGTGGTTPGTWYKTDADNTYSSTSASVIGMVPAAISSGASGTVRLQGRVTGLSGLTVGAVYYVSATAGLLTISAPANAVFVGAADTTTSIVIQPSSSATAGLDARVTVLEADVLTLQGEMTTAQADITTLETLTAGAEGSQATIDARLDNTLAADGFIVAPYTKTITQTAGTGTGTGPASVRINYNVTSTPNSGSGADNTLHTYTVPANTLDADGDAIRYTAWGNYTNNANTKTIKIWFGATSASLLAVAAGGYAWRMDAIIIRTGAATQLLNVSIISYDDGGLKVTSTNATPAETLSGTVVLKVTGQSGTAANDIYQLGSIVEVI